MGQFGLASALTIDCHTYLCFYGHPSITVQSTMLNTKKRPEVAVISCC